MTEITYHTTAEDVASRSLQVTVPVERLAAAERKALREYTRQARIPGFRKGHVPEPVIRRRFEQEIRRHVIEDALRESWETIVKESDLKPTADPQVSNLSFEQGQPLVFDMTVEVRPSIALATTGGFTLSRTVAPVSQEAIQDRIDRLREQKASWTPVEGSRPKPGQMVTVAVTTVGDEAPEPSKPYSMVIGKGQAIPDLEDLVMGLMPGETAEGDVRFPDDHPDEARRGEARRVSVALHEVKEQVLPPYDDAFAREVGEFESAEALTEVISADLAEEAVRTADQGVREQLIDHLVRANDVPAPPSLVRRLVRAYAEGYGIDAERLDAFAGTFAPIAEAQVRRELVLDSVGSAQNLQATEGDIDARVAALASARGVEPGALYASLQQARRLDELERTITEEKTFAWLLEQSTVTEVSA
ncbi:MAG: trigger factor [Gemmatimonadales bacterium]|nr:trigger factor [Gemmatimonadales bacterium]